jgi:alkylhydroperoxidase family enzyme
MYVGQRVPQVEPLTFRLESIRMEPMYLTEIEHHNGADPWAQAIQQMRETGQPISQIMHLFAFKPDRTQHLAQFTQGVMRGPSPLSPGQRELIAAFTSRRNDCPF